MLIHPHRLSRAAFVAVLVALITAHSAAAQEKARTSNAVGTFAALSAKADAARDADKLDQAVSLYNRALALRPSWAEGWWSLGTLEYDRNRYQPSSRAFRKLITLQPSNGTAYAMLGLCEFELGRADAALQRIQKGESLGLQKNPDLWHVVLFHEGILLQRKGSFQAAQDTLEELCLQAGPSDQVAGVLGMTMLRSNAKDAPAPSSEDGNVVLSVGRAGCLAGQKKYDEAQPIFEKLVAEYPKYRNIHYAYGLFLIELRDVDGSVNQMKVEIANYPDNVIARLRIAATQFKVDSAAGLPFAEEAVKLDPKSPFGHYILGLLRLDVDDFQNAIPELETALKGMPKEPKIFLALGTAYSRAGRKNDALRARATFQRLTDEAKAKASPSQSADVSGDTQIRVDDSAVSAH